MQLVNLGSKRNIQNIDKQSDERNWINMIEEKVSDKINDIDEND